MYHLNARKTLYKRYHKRPGPSHYSNYLKTLQLVNYRPYTGLKHTVGRTLQTKIIDNNPSYESAIQDVPISSSGMIMQFASESSANGYTIVGIPQGTGYNNRIGNNVRITAIRGKLVFKIPAGSVGGDNIRVGIFEDKQANGSAPTYGQIFQSAVVGSFQNWYYVDRFNLVWDKIYDLNPPTSVVATQTSQIFFLTVTFSIKVNKPVRFSSTYGVLTEIQSTNFGMYACSSLGNATLSGQETYIRVYFKDEQ